MRGKSNLHLHIFPCDTNSTRGFIFFRIFLCGSSRGEVRPDNPTVPLGSASPSQCTPPVPPFFSFFPIHNPLLIILFCWGMAYFFDISLGCLKMEYQRFWRALECMCEARRRLLPHRPLPPPPPLPWGMAPAVVAAAKAAVAAGALAGVADAALQWALGWRHRRIKRKGRRTSWDAMHTAKVRTSPPTPRARVPGGLVSSPGFCCVPSFSNQRVIPSPTVNHQRGVRRCPRPSGRHRGGGRGPRPGGRAPNDRRRCFGGFPIGSKVQRTKITRN